MSNFFSLPREIRDQIYELVLLDQEPIVPWFYYNGRHKLTLALLRANKTVHHETSSLLYARNRFDLTIGTPENVASFFARIGRKNADHIRHIYVDFPRFLRVEPDNVTLYDESAGILANIQSSCVNLTTLTMSRSCIYDMEVDIKAQDNPKVATEALELVNTHFRAITSLQEIIVEVYEDEPSDHIRRSMESHGWTIRTISHVEMEGSDGIFGDFYSFGDDDDDDDDDDSYDIDNDSDYWRRAAD
ncbi:MAG: hypothetical protein L6R38_005521 [Xanthoria sp. 2 TBL-2021]|nr:MAG: hypothetical protein L6R38_005521 [Xanthoria sp. 2 TBL-2021]